MEKFKEKVIVTGGAGFIGSHLVEELMKRGSRVFVIDNLSTGRIENIRLIPGNNLEFIQGNINNLPLLEKLFEGAEYVFHQAANASVPESINDPMAVHEANLTGTLKVLLAARNAGVKKVVCASSCAIYGDSPILPKREDMNPAPQSPYAVTKLSSEHYCHIFQKNYGLQTICLRYFNVYGPGQNPNSEYSAVIPKFIKRALANQPLVIFGNGKQSRDFVFVEDVVTANLLAATSNTTGVFNIGTGKECSLNTLASMINQLIGNNTEPIHEKSRSGDIEHSVADIMKSKVLGYFPKYKLEEGLKRTIQIMTDVSFQLNFNRS